MVPKPFVYFNAFIHVDGEVALTNFAIQKRDGQNITKTI